MFKNEEDIVNFTRVIESLYIQSQMEILELKSAIAKMEKLIDDFAN